MRHRWELLGYTDLTNNPAGRIYNRIPGFNCTAYHVTVPKKRPRISYSCYSLTQIPSVTLHKFSHGATSECLRIWTSLCHGILPETKMDLLRFVLENASNAFRRMSEDLLRLLILLFSAQVAIFSESWAALAKLRSASGSVFHAIGIPVQSGRPRPRY